MKKIACLAMALVLVLGLSLSSFAAEDAAATYTFTVTDPDGTTRTVTAPVPPEGAVLDSPTEPETVSETAPAAETVDAPAPAPAPSAVLRNEAYRLLDAASKRMEGKSQELFSDSKIKMTVDGATVDVDVKMSMKFIETPDGDIEYSLTQTMDMTPQIKIRQYYRDGWSYSHISTQFTESKTKQRVPLDDIMKQLESGSFANIEQLNAEMFADATLEDLESGGKIVRCVIPGELMNDIAGELLDSMLGDEMEMDYRYGDVITRYTIGDDGMIESNRMRFAAAITVEGTEILAEYDMKQTYHSIGTFKEIPFPSDLDDYETAAMLSNI